MRLFPSKSDTWVKGATDHVVSSARSWQLPSSSAYSLLLLSLQNDAFESLVHIWPLWGLIYDSREGFFSNCINLYILNEALGYSMSVSGLHASGFCRDIMVVFSKDWFNQTKSPNLESNPNLANQIHCAKHVSLWFMAKQCLDCHRVEKVWRIFLGNSAELGKESGKWNLYCFSHHTLRYSESSGGRYGGQKQAGFLSVIAEASAVLVVKSWQNCPSSFAPHSGPEPLSSNFITPAEDTLPGLRSPPEQIG